MPDDYLQLRAAVLRVIGLDLGLYKRAQMERRLRTFAAQRGHRDLAALGAALEEDGQLPGQMLSYLTIHVSEFFRDPRFFAELRAIVQTLPRRPGGLRAWSAGCSVGAEAYTLAMLLREERPGEPFAVTATDVDELSLERARAGLYRREELRQVDEERRRRYFRPEDGQFRVLPELGRQISFRHHDLLRDPYPAPQDLILFRNVAIYFTDEAKESVLRRLGQALAPQGVLMVGSTEAILQPEVLGLRPVRPFFFRRAL